MGGLEPEDIYPYEGHEGQCHITKSEFAVYINDSVQLPSNETAMAAWLVQKGPISVG